MKNIGKNHFVTIFTTLLTVSGMLWVLNGEDHHGIDFFHLQELITKLSQTPPGRGHCATYSTGWTNSSLPVRAGDIADITLCFDLSKNNGVEYDCENVSMGKVSNCGDYFVYYLPNVPNCVSRYCATDW